MNCFVKSESRLQVEVHPKLISFIALEVTANSTTPSRMYTFDSQQTC